MAAIAAPHLLEKFLDDSEVSGDDKKAIIDKYCRLCWWGRRQGSTQTGCPPSCAAQVQLQFEGSRVVAILDMHDLPYFGDEVKEWWALATGSFNR